MKNSVILGQYAKHLEREQFSDGTVQNYTGQILRYYCWLQPHSAIICPILERKSVLGYKAYLLQEKKVKPGTVNTYLSALSSFNGFLLEHGLQTDIVIRSKDFMKMQTVLSNPWDGEDEDVERLAHTVQKSGKKFSVRDYAILTIMAYAGLRVSETINLEIDDVDFSAHELFVRNGKGQKSRTVYMNAKIVNAIEAYLKIRPTTTNNTLFLSRTGRKLTRRRIQQVISNHSSDLTPHKLRHYFCSQSQSVAGYSIMETAQQAGHRNPQTTMRYSHPRKKDILAKANKM